jgi:Ca-activated chloride channel family protein
MTGSVAAVLKTEQGATIPLKGVTASGRLEGLLFELAVEQVYENTGRRNIEAEFTFPVPHWAVLLGLELRIGERALEAVAVRRGAARETYEKAMDEGDTAALLEEAGDGLWHLSLGNLLAGEKAVIRYRYAELLDRQGDTVRLTVPTVIAPRYGEPVRAGLAHHQVPGTDLLAEYPFALTVDVIGDMSRAEANSPTHKLERTAIEGGLRVTLAPGAWLDRDFVLRLAGPVTRAAGLVAPDPGREGGTGYTALLSLDPGLTAAADATPLALKLLVDCSGSMGGTSIECARRALQSVVSRLAPRDRVSLTRFGSTVDHVTPGLLAAGGSTVASLEHAVRHLDADLGGTELAAGLQAVLAIPAADAAVRDILLITDAEVWDLDGVLDAVADAGHRLFVVAVGAAPAEALSRRLAEETGGACEFVAPGEDAEAAILRMFKRLREPPKRVAAVRWPVEPEWTLPLPAAVFSGDTLHLMAGFATPPAGDVTVVIAGASEGELSLHAGLGAVTASPVLPRLAAARRLPHLEDEAAAALAERHQLASRHTSLVVVKARADGEKATDLPRLATVPHMLAAGWGATAMAPRAYYSGAADSMDLMMKASPRYAAVDLDNLQGPRASAAIDWSPLAYGEPAETREPAEVLASLAAVLKDSPDEEFTLDALARLGVAPAAIEALADAIRDEDLDEVAAVRCWIAHLAVSLAGDALTPEDQALLEGSVAGDRRLRLARAVVRGLLAGVTPTDWPGGGQVFRVAGGG